VGTPTGQLSPHLRYADDGLPEGWPQDVGIPTLGLDVLAWSETELAQPDGDLTGEPWAWRDSQARFLCWWYAIDAQGRWLWRRGQIVLPKGAGKSPVAAAVSCCELAGPVYFDGWTAAGDPVGRPHPSPWVQLAAVSADQTENTMALALSMLREGQAADSVPGLDLGVTRIRTRNGFLQPVTASAPSREGQRSTAAILDESHLWNGGNGGVRLAATIRRNLAKMGGRSIETTNTWVPGVGSVAQMTFEYATKVREALDDPTRVEALGREGGVLRWHPSVSVPNLADVVSLRSGLEELYRDSPWVSIDRLMAEINDRGTDPQDARRYYLNEITYASDSWLSAPEWAACGPLRDEPDTMKVIGDRDPVVLGFDGSRHRAFGVTDATALVGCRVSDGHVFQVRVWEQPDNTDDWEVPTTEVDAEVHGVFTKYNVVGFYADPAKWESYIASWEAKYGSRLKVKSTRNHPIEWWMVGGRALQTVRALEQFYSAVVDNEMSHDGSSALTRHILNARRRVSTAGTQIAKANPDSPLKIDAAVAAVLAWQARLDALAAGVGVQSRKVIPSRIR